MDGFQFKEIAHPPQPSIGKGEPAGFGGRGFWGFGVKFGGQICKGCPAGSCTLGQHSPWCQSVTPEDPARGYLCICTCVFVELYLKVCIFV